MNFKKIVSEMIFPPHISCLVCGDELFEDFPYDICPRCQLAAPGHICLKCGRATRNLADYCEDCKDFGRNFDLARAVCLFEGPAKKLIYKFKYGGARYAAPFLAQMIFDKLPAPGADVVTWVPLHKKRLKERGYNQARLVAEELSGRYGLPCGELLTRAEDTPHLTKLGKAERAAAMKNAITAVNGLNGKRILLVDDVFTTGITSDTCAAALKKAGASFVAVYTFATARVIPELY